DHHASQRSRTVSVRNGPVLRGNRSRGRPQSAGDGNTATCRAAPRAAGTIARGTVRGNQRFGQALQLVDAGNWQLFGARWSESPQAGKDSAPEHSLPRVPRRGTEGSSQAFRTVAGGHSPFR